MIHQIDGELTLAELIDIRTADNVRINDITLSDKDSQSVLWLKNELYKVMENITGSTLVYFDFNTKYKDNDALLLYTKDEMVHRMVWKSDRPLELIKAISRRKPLYAHIVKDKLESKELSNKTLSLEVCIGNRMYLKSKKGSILIPYSVINESVIEQPTMRHLTQIIYDIAQEQNKKQ